MYSSVSFDKCTHVVTTPSQGIDHFYQPTGSSAGTFAVHAPLAPADTNVLAVTTV